MADNKIDRVEIVWALSVERKRERERERERRYTRSRVARVHAHYRGKYLSIKRSVTAFRGTSEAVIIVGYGIYVG